MTGKVKVEGYISLGNEAFGGEGDSDMGRLMIARHPGRLKVVNNGRMASYLPPLS